MDSQLKNSALVVEHIPACRNNLHIALMLGSLFRSSIHKHFISLLNFKNVVPFSLQIPQTVVQQKRLNLNGDLNIFYGFQIPGFDTLKTGLAGPILASLAYKFVPLKPATFYLVPHRNILHLLCIRTSGSFKSPVFVQFSEHERFEHQTDHSKKQMNCMCIGTINDLT